MCLGFAECEFKSKDIITTLNYFETGTIQTVQLSLVMFGKKKENKKRNTNSGVRNNSNCCNIHKHNKAMFFMSPREVSYTHVSKSERTFKKKIRASFKVLACSKCSYETNFYCKRFIVMIEGNIYTLRYPQIN